jgi:putative phosphoesterase
LTNECWFDYYDTVMRIGLLADTHIPDVEERLPSEVARAFSRVDLILHAGDIYAPSVLDDLEQIAPVLAARGDDDYLSALRDKRVQEKHVLKLDGHILWLVHERAYYLQSSWFQSRVPTGQERYDFPDIVVFGHEHRTVEQRIDNILFISPGSPTFLGYRYGLGTVGILNINSGRVDVNILQL